MAVVIEGYSEHAATSGFFWTTGTVGSGRWLLSISGLSGGLAEDAMRNPGADDGDALWQLLTPVDAGPYLPKLVVWARRITTPGVFHISIAGQNGMDSHGHLYVLSGLRDSPDAQEVFMVGSASSATGGTPQTVPLYAADGSELLIGAWLSGSLVDYTSLGGLTARTELDASSSTSRAGEQTLSVAGPSSRTATPSVGAPWAAVTIAVRGDTGGAVTFPAQSLGMKVELAPGANPNADPAAWAGLWTDITDDAQPRNGGVSITRGRQDETSTVGPSSMTVTLNNTGGKYVRLNPNSPFYGRLSKNTPARLWVNPGDGWRLRYTGFVSEWPPRSQGGEVDENMPVRVDGPIRRLSRGKVLSSAVRKAIATRGNAAGYWPLETDASTGITGGIDMRTRGAISFGSGGPVGSAGAMTAPFGASTFSTITGMQVAGGWQVSFWLDVPANSSDLSPVAYWTTLNSSFGRWGAYANSPAIPNVLTVEIAQHTTLATELFVIGSTDVRGLGPILVTVRAANSGSNVRVTLLIDGVLESSNTVTGDAVAAITSIGVNNLNFATAFSISGQINHLYASPVDPSLSDSAFSASLAWLIDAGAGHLGERATDRILRVSTEEGVPLAIVGDDGTSVPMGPQPVNDYLDVLRDCESADGGVLYERRDGRLGYQARSGRYNAEPTLTLNYEAGHVAPPLEPTDDDQHIVNDFTASRSNGGSARVFDQDHIDTVGSYADSGSVNVADDDQLPDLAGWRVHLGTVDGLRYPSLVPNLNGRPTLIPDWADADVGRALAVTNPGRDLPPGTIGAIMEGYTEIIDTVSWTATANASPGDPWQVLVLDDNALGRLDTAGSVLATATALPETPGAVENFEDATPNITITDGGNLPWTRTNTTAHTGSWCLRSGTITDNQTSDAIVTVPAGATACTFWYRVSSEPTFDFLRVLVDGIEKVAVSGESYGWQHGAIDVTGASTVTFRYAKDAFTSRGDDAAFVDDVEFITAETISVATVDGPAWTTDPADYPLDVLVGGEQMTALTVTPYATDTFTRTVSSGWGMADTGQAWTAVVGPAPASDYSVSSGLGRHSLSAVNQHMFTTIPTSSAYFDIRADLATDRLAVGSDIILYLVGRFADTSNYYMANVGLTTSQAVVLTIRRSVAGTETHLGGGPVGGLQHAANTRYGVRFRGDGTLLRAKVWLAADPEPDAWTVTVTDTAITGAGAVGMRSLITGGYTGTLPVVATYDNVTANPQQMTVVRSVNGVVRTHSPGEDVQLATPPTLSL